MASPQERHFDTEDEIIQMLKDEEEYYGGYSSDEDDTQPSERGPEDNEPDELTQLHGPSTSSEKRRAQQEIFMSFAAKKAEEITKEEINDSLKTANDETLSIRNILAKQEGSSKITSPRDYQTELFQKAKEENIIAVLDTGSGKTHIATLLLRHILDEELQHRADGKPHRIAFFLVRTISGFEVD